MKEAEPWAVMTSYNGVNGYNCGENYGLIAGILRGEWGFDGLVMTDWHTTVPLWREVAAGNDVKMGCGYPERVLAALEQGAITRADLLTAAKHVLGMILKLD